VGGRPHKQSAIQLAEERYNESREADAMQVEDNLSVAVENAVEDANCRQFMQRLSFLLHEKWAMDEDKDDLKRMAAAIKPINVNSIFAGEEECPFLFLLIILSTCPLVSPRRQH
jgi:hypothetical protein